MATHTYLEFAEVAVVIAESRKPRCCGWGSRRLRAAGNLQYVAHFGPPGDCRMPDEFLPSGNKGLHSVLSFGLHSASLEPALVLSRP